ncbi:MAG: hypothetical protein HQK50_09610, partial [Oligoflexia bacterium]|nr:hypothetical protein [Oligoflexia bacterium]
CPVRFSLQAPAALAMVRIFDSRGNMMAELAQENMTSGSHEMTWNGKNLDSSYAEKGTYSFQVLAYDEAGQKVAAETMIAGVVSGVEFEGENTVLTVNGQKLDLRDVNSFESNEKTTLKPTGFQNGYPNGYQNIMR